MPPNLQITDADLQTLLAQNPLAAEQLRRIMAERQRDELAAELDQLRNGASDPEAVPATDK
jgi:hypothetical protein